MKKHKGKIGTIAVVSVFSIIIIACLISIFSQMYAENKADSDFKHLSEVTTVEEPIVTETDSETINDISDDKLSISNMSYTTYRQHSISDLISMNDDCIGWVSIPNTGISYPVMHTPNNHQKYLNKDFYGNYSCNGTPFLDYRCTPDSTNMIIYGHHMNNGSMFAGLCNYESKSYRDEHSSVVLETKDGASAYTVFAVMKVKSNDDWYRFTTALNEKKYNLMIEYAKENSIYNTGITPVYNQQILTLSTCYGYNQDDRILVLAFRN